MVGPPGSIKTVLCEKLSKDHGFSHITLGEAQRLAVRGAAMGPEVKTAMDEKVAKDKKARKEGTAVSTGWAGTDELNMNVLKWLFTESEVHRSSFLVSCSVAFLFRVHFLICHVWTHTQRCFLLAPSRTLNFFITARKAHRVLFVCAWRERAFCCVFFQS